MAPELLISVFGIASGFWLVVAIAIASYLAPKWTQSGTLADVVVRIGVIALLTLPAAHLLGQFFGSQVRQYAAWFWGSWAASFVVTPWLLGQVVKRIKPTT